MTNKIVLLLTLSGWFLAQETDWCPIYGDSYWIDYASELNCGFGYTFHCARLYNTSRMFRACARERMCLIGTEPWLRFLKGETKYAHVFCEYCFDDRLYNSENKTLSSHMSKCPRQKERCSNTGLVECPRALEIEKYTKNRECRCDARRSYVPWCTTECDTGPCTSRKDMQQCYYQPCPDGEERLIQNYSCVKKCEYGHRTDNSDACTSTTTETQPSTTKPHIDPSTLTPVVTTDISKRSSTPHSPSLNGSTSTITSSTIVQNNDARREYMPVIIITVSIVVGLSVFVSIVILVYRLSASCQEWYADIRRHGIFDRGPRHSEDRGLSSSVDSLDSVEVHPIADNEGLSYDQKCEVAAYALDNCLQIILNRMETVSMLAEIYTLRFITHEEYMEISEDRVMTKRNKNNWMFNILRGNLTVEKYDKFKFSLKNTQQDEILNALQDREQYHIHVQHYFGNSTDPFLPNSGATGPSSHRQESTV